MENLSNKAILRTELKAVRATLNPQRKEEASHALLLHLLPTLIEAERVLSFSSFGHEIDTSLINHYLARTGRLLLPKIEGENLKIYRVTDLQNHLIPTPFGLYEPHPKYCSAVDPGLIQIVLVPALGFDAHNHRLGYGYGFYDRFLPQIPQAHTIGIGFKEQLLPHLPSDERDIPLEKVSLF